MMLNSSDLQQIDKAYPRLRTIWIAMIVSLGAYVLFANLLGPVFGLMPMFAEPDDPALIKYGYGLYGVAVAELVVAYFFRRALIRQKSGRTQLTDRFDSFLSTPTELPDIPSVEQAVGLYKNGMLLCLGISEAIGLCGFMGYVIRTDYVQLYVLTAVSLVALIYVRPRKEEMIALANKLEEEKEQRRRSVKH